MTPEQEEARLKELLKPLTQGNLTQEYVLRLALAEMFDRATAELAILLAGMLGPTLAPPLLKRVEAMSLLAAMAQWAQKVRECLTPAELALVDHLSRPYSADDDPPPPAPPRLRSV